MFKKIIILFISLLLSHSSIIPLVLAAGLPVFDGVAAVNFLQQMEQLKQQYETLKNQLFQAERMYNSITGSRGFGNILRNTELQKYLPNEMQSIYNSINRARYHDISGSIKEILAEEKLEGSINEMQQHIEKRTQETAATDKAIGIQAYKGAQQRLLQIESLMNKINTTNDGKGIAELQARIVSEQAAVQNEITKLQMIHLLQDVEQRLVLNQRQELNMRILNSKNTEMPRIKQ